MSILAAHYPNSLTGSLRTTTDAEPEIYEGTLRIARRQGYEYFPGGFGFWMSAKSPPMIASTAPSKSPPVPTRLTNEKARIKLAHFAAFVGWW